MSSRLVKTLPWAGVAAGVGALVAALVRSLRKNEQLKRDAASSAASFYAMQKERNKLAEKFAELQRQARLDGESYCAIIRQALADSGQDVNAAVVSGAMLARDWIGRFTAAFPQKYPADSARIAHLSNYVDPLVAGDEKAVRTLLEELCFGTAIGQTPEGKYDYKAVANHIIRQALPVLLRFEGIANLSAREIQRIYREIPDMKTWTLALCQTSQEIRDAIRQNVSIRLWAMLDEEITVLGSVRQDEIAAAQTQICFYVFKLFIEGEITLLPDAKPSESYFEPPRAAGAETQAATQQE